MVDRVENELITRVEGDAPLGRLMREHAWIPFALSDNLVAGDAPTAVRLLGENFVAFRAEDGRIGFFDELCPHRRASLLLAHVEGNGLRCIYHGWKMDVPGCVVDCPTQVHRPEQFAKSIRFPHFTVHEAGGIAWVWLGDGDAPPFPELPFTADHGVNTNLTISVLPCNWLQGLEGGLDSVHATILHQTWIRDIVARQRGSIDTEGVESTFAAPPVYETEPAPFGLTTASVRPAGDDQKFIRISHYFFPLVIVVPTGYEDHTQVFAFAPIDDTHHLVVFGNYGTIPQMSQHGFGSVRDDVEPDPRNFASVGGGRADRWGQDRALLDGGHFSGIGRSVIDEDATVQVSMGPISDRPGEHLSASDVAVAQARRVILDAIAAVEAGGLPPGSARSPEPVRIPHPFEATLDLDVSWREMARSR
jgi:phenylpropionate dioxygenase-like ring-hydroxylating dioxygenase large terminal subunit